jgi:hypothetical protein
MEKFHFQSLHTLARHPSSVYMMRDDPMQVAPPAL